MVITKAHLALKRAEQQMEREKKVSTKEIRDLMRLLNTPEGVQVHLMSESFLAQIKRHGGFDGFHDFWFNTVTDQKASIGQRLEYCRSMSKLQQVALELEQANTVPLEQRTPEELERIAAELMQKKFGIFPPPEPPLAESA